MLPSPNARSPVVEGAAVPGLAGPATAPIILAHAGQCLSPRMTTGWVPVQAPTVLRTGPPTAPALFRLGATGSQPRVHAQPSCVRPAQPVMRSARLAQDVQLRKDAPHPSIAGTARMAKARELGQRLQDQVLRFQQLREAKTETETIPPWGSPPKPASSSSHSPSRERDRVMLELASRNMRAEVEHRAAREMMESQAAKDSQEIATLREQLGCVREESKLRIQSRLDSARVQELEHKLDIAKQVTAAVARQVDNSRSSVQTEALPPAGQCLQRQSVQVGGASAQSPRGSVIWRQENITNGSGSGTSDKLPLKMNFVFPPLTNLAEAAHAVVQHTMSMVLAVSQETIDLCDHEWLGPGDSDPLSLLLGCSNNVAATDVLVAMAAEAQQVLASQPILVEASQPAVIFGDLSGQLRDLLLLLSSTGLPKAGAGPDFVFLGNWAGDGAHQLEVVAIMLALKVTFPDRVWLIRGTNEDMDSVLRPTGFLQHCVERLGQDAGFRCFLAVQQACNWLPLACTVGSTALALHGGIGSAAWSMQDLAVERRPLNHESLWEDALLCNLLWSQPNRLAGSDSDSLAGLPYPQHVGKITLFDSDATANFLQRNSLRLIVCGGRHLPLGRAGFESVHNETVVQVISARDIRGERSNDASVVVIQDHPQGLLDLTLLVLPSCKSKQIVPSVPAW
mmetsp:Transcript_23916/g.43885  ORF Transcript_23916/g.43885 Transcript_23916/m.43885 type:complete len:680 (-) Transcript_23916:151-2190(-)